MSSPAPTTPTVDRTTPFDVILAVAVVLLGLPEAAHGPTSWPIALALDFALVPPLLWRRRAPIESFYTVSAVALAQWLIGPHDTLGTHAFTAYHLAADIALLVTFYNVAAREPRRRTVVAAGVLEVALLAITLGWLGGPKAVGLFVLLSGTAAAAGVSGNNTRTRRAYLASLEQRAAALQCERDQQARLAVAAERARIARDMHDVVAHNISVMIALADGATYAAAANPEQALEAMNQVSTTGRQALGEMRRLLGVLRDGDQPATMQPQPALADLEALLAPVRLTGLHGALVTEGPLSALPPGLQLAVYRLVQEALTNTLKHAVDAQSATVYLRVTGGRLYVDVIDDGRSPPSASAIGHGITGMRERAALYGGVVQAGPQPGRGWRVHAQFDLNALAS